MVNFNYTIFLEFSEIIPLIIGLVDGWPDLRNLVVNFHQVDEGDIIISMSDGVHDNFDPQTEGYLPRHFGMNYDNWNDAPAVGCSFDSEDSLTLRSEHRCNN